MPYHPTFNVPRFALASRNRFFLCIEATDPLFDRKATEEFLESLEAREVYRSCALSSRRAVAAAASVRHGSAARRCSPGCRQDMQDQPKYIPLRPSTFFADGRSARPLVEGTVARGHLNADTAFYTGKVGDKPVERFPSRSRATCWRAGRSATTSTARPATTAWATATA